MGSTWLTKGDVVTVLRCQANLTLPLRCSISLGIAPVAPQAIPTAFPALVNPAVRALAIAKRWWVTFQHRCAPFAWNICSRGNKCSTALQSLFVTPRLPFLFFAEHRLDIVQR
jgi:hypothetical protein